MYRDPAPLRTSMSPTRQTNPYMQSSYPTHQQQISSSRGTAIHPQTRPSQQTSHTQPLSSSRNTTIPQARPPLQPSHSQPLSNIRNPAIPQTRPSQQPLSAHGQMSSIRPAGTRLPQQPQGLANGPTRMRPPSAPPAPKPKNIYALRDDKDYKIDNASGYGIIRNGKKQGAWIEYYEYIVANHQPQQIIFQGNYLDGKKTGFCMEYDYFFPNSKMVFYVCFKGDYLDGKRNGDGESIDERNNTTFRGLYKDDYRMSGHAAEYAPDCIRKVFIGELKDGLRNGPGESYHYSGVIEYKGMWKNNLMWGEGILYRDRSFFKPQGGAIKYQGHFVRGKMHGKGTLNHEDGSIFEGTLYNGKIKHGKLNFTNGEEYEGEFSTDIRGCREGEGKMWYKGGKLKYDGSWQNDEYKYGQLNNEKDDGYYIGKFSSNKKEDTNGHFVESNGLVYVGPFKNDKKHGTCSVYSIKTKETLLFKGDYQNGKKVKGTVFYGSGATYDGYVKDVGEEIQRSGKGRYTDPKGFLRYEGEYYRDLRHGLGKSYKPNGIETIYEGKWKSDKKNGHGTLKCENGDTYVGRFLNDEYHGAGLLYKNLASKELIYDGYFAHNLYDDHGILYSTTEKESNGKQKILYNGMWKDGEQIRDAPVNSAFLAFCYAVLDDVLHWCSSRTVC